MIINIGLLKHNISIYRSIEEIDAEGFKTKEYKKLFTCKAALERRKEKNEDFGVRATVNKNEINIQCVIRYANITTDDLVELDGVRYSISGIEDIDFQKRFLRITLSNER